MSVDSRKIDAYLARSAAEQVLSVDEQDQSLAQVSRAQVQAERLITRCTYIFVFNVAGQLCLHQRTLHKRLYPGYWDVAAGGLVAAGESYLEGARRELAEELGVAGVDLHSHGRFFYDAPESRLWGAVFSCRWDGPIEMQPEEVLAVRWIDLDTDWRQADERYTPDSLLALERWRAGQLLE
ncbi:NUDIX hydrolase [Pseudomonas sp. WN033]|nr:NUDIX hydrolase [Pseudomonas sp. WN033]